MVVAVESALEIAAGVGVELFLVTLAGAAIYRFFAGRFLIPKREVVLPTQIAVLVHGEEYVRLVGPGPAWVRPGRKLMLFDARPRNLHMEGLEVLSQDGAIFRLNVNGEYAISDPVTYFRSNAQSADAFYLAVRRMLQESARKLSSTLLTSSVGMSVLVDQVKASLKTPSQELGMELKTLDAWGLFQAGWATQPEPPQGSGLVH